jgi:(p)ppGpp synthase/HD superfamily hydrolase
MKEYDLVPMARDFAERAHRGQVRKYTGEPYFNHVAEVAGLVTNAGGSLRMIAAAYLHDVVEDTPTTNNEISRVFGAVVGSYVYWLTDQSKPEDGNRATRKAIDRNHIRCAPKEAKTIKLADLISNTRTIVRYDPDFARVYLMEKRLLLDVLTEGERGLWYQADALCTQGMKELGMLPLEETRSICPVCEDSGVYVNGAVFNCPECA